MLHTNTATYESPFRPRVLAAPFPRVPTSERAVDETLAESFPASDPPSWNPGLVRPAPVQDVPRSSGHSSGSVEIVEQPPRRLAPPFWRGGGS